MAKDTPPLPAWEVNLGNGYSSRWMEQSLIQWSRRNAKIRLTTTELNLYENVGLVARFLRSPLDDETTMHRSKNSEKLWDEVGQEIRQME